MKSFFGWLAAISIAILVFIYLIRVEDFRKCIESSKTVEVCEKLITAQFGF